jgi:PKD repeat protein
VWDFGDGASARGASVPHTYRRTGTYTVAVTQSDATGAGSRSTATIVVTRATLSNRRIPGIAGSPRVGSTLTCRPCAWSGSQPIRLRYGWLRGGAPIGNGARYRVRARDAGSLLVRRVIATNGPRTVAASSRPVRVRP